MGNAEGRELFLNVCDVVEKNFNEITSLNNLKNALNGVNVTEIHK